METEIIPGVTHDDVAKENERAIKYLGGVIAEFTGETPTAVTLLALGNAMVLTGMAPLAMGAALQSVPLQGGREVLSLLFAETSAVFEREYLRAEAHLARVGRLKKGR